MEACGSNIKNIGKRRSKHKACRSRQITYKQAWKNMDLNLKSKVWNIGEED